MGLLDEIEKGKGAPVANYARTGRHIVELTRVSFTEGGVDDGKASFSMDGRVILSLNAPEPHQPGEVVRVSEGFKFPSSGLARIRRALRAAQSSKEGRDIPESEITGARARELCAMDQPLVGAIVAFQLTHRVGKEARKLPPDHPDAGKGYDLFEVEVLSSFDEAALNAA